MWLVCVGSVGCLPDWMGEYATREEAYRTAVALVAEEMDNGRFVIGDRRDGRWHDASPTSLWTCWVEQADDVAWEDAGA